MKLLYQNLIDRLIDTGLSRKEAEHLFILAIEDIVMEMSDKMLSKDDNLISFVSRLTKKNPL